MQTTSEQLEDLIGRAPDPGADRRLLCVLQDPANPVVYRLARTFLTDNDWQHWTLRELLPGLGLVESSPFPDRLSVRAANCMMRADVGTLAAMAGMTPAAIRALPNIGVKSAEEILAAATGEWASSYLNQREGGPPKPPLERDPGATTGEGARSSLAQAFGKLEQSPDFYVFRRRRLEVGKPPTMKGLAAELGLSRSAVHQKESAIRKALSRRMRDRDWAIRNAVEDLQRSLGAVARVEELRQTFAALDGDAKALPDDMPHRRALLLQLGDYRVSGEWVRGPEIESLTKVVLSALTESGTAALDGVGRQLARLGVREELQLPWIVSQYGFQIIDGRLVRAAME